MPADDRQVALIEHCYSTTVVKTEIYIQYNGNGAKRFSTSRDKVCKTSPICFCYTVVIVTRLRDSLPYNFHY
jgi:hypothetical protein